MNAVGAPMTARARLCPTYGDPVVQPAIGHPRTYCTPACRRQMYGQIAELAELEKQIAEARANAVEWEELPDTYANRVRAERFRREVDWLARDIAEARQRVPRELRPWPRLP